jgi:metallo-beta-lactamase family protein
MGNAVKTNTKTNNLRLTEFGAAKQVAGSKLGLGVEKNSYLIDCGSNYSDEPETKLPFSAPGIDALILTHGHNDHMGDTPLLFKEGFRKNIFSTECTADISQSQFNQALNQFFLSQEPAKAAFYEGITPEVIMNLFAKGGNSGQPGFKYQQPVKIADDLTATFYEAGHIPGSSQILFDITMEDGRKSKLLTCFDLGRTDYKVSPYPITDTPFVKFPHKDFPHDIDNIVVEATYGDKTHRPLSESLDVLKECLDRTYKSGGKLIIPAFSIMRTQMLLYYLFMLDKDSKMPNMPIFFSSPSAADINRIMLKHYSDFDEVAIKQFEDKEYNPFDFEKLRYVKYSKHNLSLYNRSGPFVLLASSGMCDMGRIVGHLQHGIGDPKNTVLLTGYQSPGSVGGLIAQKEENPSLKANIPIDGGEYPLNASVYRMHGLSGHADGHEMVAHLLQIRDPAKYGPFKGVFIKHGEADQCTGLQKLIIEAGYPAETVHVMEKGTQYAL